MKPALPLRTDIVSSTRYFLKVPRTRHPRQDAATPGYRARRAKSGLGQFLQISLAHAAALVFGLFFPTSEAMESTLAALSVYALGYAIELIQRQ